MSNIDKHPSLFEIPSKTIKSDNWSKEVEKFLEEGGSITPLKPGETKLDGVIPRKSAYEIQLDFQAFRGTNPKSQKIESKPARSDKWLEAVNFPPAKRAKIIKDAYEKGEIEVELPCRYHGWTIFRIYRRKQTTLHAACRECKLSKKDK